VPIDKRLYEEMQVKREAEHRAAERDRRWSLLVSCVSCLVWAFLGLVCYGFAFHTTDAGLAEIFKWGAYVITYGGVSFTLLRAYRKGEKRGDW
jgi:O-antigen/teichoic acid export membrane protein